MNEESLWPAVHRMEAAANKAANAASSMEDAARRIAHLLEDGYGGNGLRLIELLATKSRWAGWGFVAFLAINAGWLAFSYSNAHWFMFAQQIGFTLSSLIGIWVWIVEPWLSSIFDIDLGGGVAS